MNEHFLLCFLLLYLTTILKYCFPKESKVSTISSLFGDFSWEIYQQVALLSCWVLHESLLKNHQSRRRPTSFPRLISHLFVVLFSSLVHRSFYFQISFSKMRLPLITLLLLCQQLFACQSGCKCPTRTTAVCKGSSLRSIPILLDPRTTILDLSNNRISRLSADELSLYPNLEQLILKNNSITHLSADVFSTLPHLRLLDLSSNSLLSLPNEVFSKLKNLKTLIISSNDVQLGPECFSGLSQLHTLSLADNRLSFLPPSVLKPLSGLKSLDLSANKLLSMPASVLSNLGGIETLKLKQNLLSSLETGMFVAQKELKLLDISENLIGDIEEGALYGLEKLETLNFTNNQLVRLPGNTWSLSSLKCLDLSSNLFVSLETASFDGLPSLQYLNISHSRNLKTIQMASFVQLSSLHWLSVSSSALTYIHPSAFNQIPPLSHLDLSNNELRYLAPGMLQWQNIRNLYLANNDWQCSCDLRVSNLKPRDDAKCAGPENLAGAPLNELNSCTILGGLLIPFLLVIFILLLALVILALACKRPSKGSSSSKNRAFYNDQLIAALNSHKEYSFDCHSPYTMSSEDSRDSAYESPTSALMPRRPPPSCPPPPRLLTLPRDGPMHVPPPIVPTLLRNSNDPYLIPKSSQVPISRL
ncbi:hypothetical protein L5515_000557 [Caenorhabditis briggsae]|uniref:Uncharacterized protein n=2 Tax=Caenorhabditis briggsae TaxID=6238 RepID=A0AAE9E1Y2_CAEBR|nr:hypothetical protein L5515_000557 [Caenorhabditis briggsae]